jgi:hypothetical protein
LPPSQTPPVVQGSPVEQNSPLLIGCLTQPDSPSQTPRLHGPSKCEQSRSLAWQTPPAQKPEPALHGSSGGHGRPFRESRSTTQKPASQDAGPQIEPKPRSRQSWSVTHCGQTATATQVPPQQRPPGQSPSSEQGGGGHVVSSRRQFPPQQTPGGSAHGVSSATSTNSQRFVAGLHCSTLQTPAPPHETGWQKPEPLQIWQAGQTQDDPVQPDPQAVAQAPSTVQT